MIKRIPFKLDTLALACLSTLSIAGNALAGPQGGNVSQGQASINQQGNLTSIQQLSNHATIDWQSFNIGQNETVRFNQPGVNSTVLNRIFDQNPSTIRGALQANGQVFLSNPNGIVFTATSAVNVGGLLATTSNVQFDNDRLKLLDNGSTASVINQGNIQTQGGTLAFFAPTIDNQGQLDANGGNIHLDTRTQGTVYLKTASSLFGFEVDDAAALLNQKGIDNSGEILSDGGTIVLHTDAADSILRKAVNNQGLISASSIVNDGGVIRLQASQGTALSSGQIRSDSQSGNGGEITLTAKNLGITQQGQVTADGTTGGGSLRLGGDYLGQGPTPNAEQVFLGQDTLVSADAGQQGDGGRIIVWSDQHTRSYGTINARGGAVQGDGGFVETSSAQTLNVQGQVDTSASNGESGSWLLDPGTITITNSANDNVSTAGAPDPDFEAANPTLASTLFVDTLEASLTAGSDIRVLATGAQADIIVNADITGAGTLTLQSQTGNIVINNSINSTSAANRLTLNLLADEAGDSISINAGLGTTEALSGFTANGTNLTLGGDINVATGTFNFVNTDINVSGSRTLTLGGTGNTLDLFNTATDLRGGDLIISAAGNTVDLATVGNAGNGLLSSLNVTAATLDLNGNLSTSGASGINFDNVTTLTQNTSALAISTLSGNGTLNLNADNFDTAGAVTGGSLTITSGGTLDLGTIGATDTDGYASIILNNGQTTNLNGNITVTGTGSTALDFTGANTVNLNSNVILTSNSNDAVDLSSTNISGANTLTLNSTGGAVSLGAIGQLGVAQPTSVSVNGASGITLTDNINVAGNLNLGSDVTLSTGVSINTSAGNGNITLPNVTGTSQALSLNSGSGNISLGTIDTASLTATSTGTTTLNGNVTTHSATGINLSGASNVALVTSGAQTFNTSDGNGTIRFNGGNINGNAQVTLNSGSGNITLDSLGQTTALNSLTLLSSGQVNLSGSLALQGTGTAFDLTQATTVSLINDTTINTSANNGAIDLTGTSVNGSNSLTLNSGTGTLSLGSFGATTDINNLVVSAAGTTTLNGNIETIGSTGIDLSGASSVVLASNINLSNTNDGSISFGNSVNGPFNLGITVNGGAVNLQAVGDNAASLPTGLTITRSGSVGTTTLNNNIVLAGALNFSQVGNVAFAADRTINTSGSNGEINLSGASISSSNGLTLLSGTGDIRLGTASLGSLNITNTGSTILNGSLTTSGSGAVTQPDGSVIFTGLDFSGTSAITLEGDSTLNGPVNFASTRVDGDFALTINSQTHDLSLFSIGQTTALDSLTVTGTGTATLNNNITTQGVNGINLSGISNVSLAGAITLNSSAADGNINLANANVNGAQILTLNGGEGTVSLGSVGATTALSQLVLTNSGELQLGNTINTALGYDFSAASGITLTGDVTLDTSAVAGAINLGSGGIEGTFNLALNSGDGIITLGNVGQNTALQSLDIDSNVSQTLSSQITTVGNITVDTNDALTLSGDLRSTGGNVTINTVNNLAMTATGSITANDGQVTATTTMGNIQLGEITAANASGSSTNNQGQITLTATAGNITNAIDDFVSIGNTSVNLTANTLTLNAGGQVGTSTNSPVVISVPQNNTITLSQTNPQAFIVNINSATINAGNTTVIDGQQDSRDAANQATSLTLFPEAVIQSDALDNSDKVLYAVLDSSYIWPANLTIFEETLSESTPAVPSLFRDQQGWSLRYSAQQKNHRTRRGNIEADWISGSSGAGAYNPEAAGKGKLRQGKPNRASSLFKEQLERYKQENQSAVPTDSELIEDNASRFIDKE